MSLDVFHHPRSVAVVGASTDPDKIGGRPLRYLQEFGFAGAIYPINPQRPEVQGLPAFASLDDLPEVPEVAIIAVSGERGVEQILRCAELGVRGCVIMASGYGETGDPQGLQWQRQILAAARATGMRLVGPNAQGLANFGSGAILNFSTLFIEEPPHDGPVAIVSQSGALSSVPYGLLRQAGVGVRYAHATGNDIDVTAAELAAEVLRDPEVRILLLYIEDITDLGSLVDVARLALERRVPVIALKGGSSAEGQKAAASHTGALATEDRVVDAFLQRHGIWRARSTDELVAAVGLYLRADPPSSEGLAIVSNSGAICVLAADAAAEHGVGLAELSAASKAALTERLPSFAAVENPVDVTAALLTDSSLFGKVLPVLAEDAAVGACLVGIPVAGRGYDVERFASDVAAFEAIARVPVVMAVPQPSVAATFRAHGTVVFADERQAVRVLAQFIRHHALIEQARSRVLVAPVLTEIPASTATLNEADSLALLERIGVPAVEHVLVHDPDEIVDALARLGDGPYVVKGCSSEATHKSELGLVRVGIGDEAGVFSAVAAVTEAMARAGVADEGAIVARMVRGLHEGLLGARVDPVFGPIVLIGAGGIHVEAMPDIAFLLPPFTVQDALDAIAGLRISAVVDGVRGAPPIDRRAWAQAAVALGDAMVSGADGIRELDVNPLMLLPDGVRAVDGVVVRG